MSPDWFDPLGFRGSRLDPFTMFAEVLRGDDLASQSAEMVATTMAKRLVGRRVEIDRDPLIAATVDTVDEVVPASGLGALSNARAEVPMWRRLRGRLVDVTVGARRLVAVDLTVTGVRVAGPTARRMRIDRVEFLASVAPAEIAAWAATVDGSHAVRVRDDRLEATNRRVARWAWVEVAVVASHQTITVTPVGLRVLGFSVPLLARFRRPVHREAPWLPTEVVVAEVRATRDAVLVRGSLSEVVVPVDLTRLLTELSNESRRSVLRIVSGDW